MWSVVTMQCLVPVVARGIPHVLIKANWLCGLVMSDADTQNVKTDTSRLENYFRGIDWNCPRYATCPESAV